MLGQEKYPGNLIDYEIEREATRSELAAWNDIERVAETVRLVKRIIEMQILNLMIMHDFLKAHQISYPMPELTDLFSRTEFVKKEMIDLSSAMYGVSIGMFAVRFTDDDIDIIKPSPFQPKGGGKSEIGPDEPVGMGAIWLPIAIGAVVVAGIIARWIFLEKETAKISDHYNGLLKRADDHLCADPLSEICIDWKQTKETGGYKKRETIIGNIKSAIKGTGQVLKKGLGFGAVLALPILAMMLFSKQKEG